MIDVEIYIVYGFLSIGEISPNLTNYICEKDKERREEKGGLEKHSCINQKLFQSLHHNSKHVPPLSPFFFPTVSRIAYLLSLSQIFPFKKTPMPDASFLLLLAKKAYTLFRPLDSLFN